SRSGQVTLASHSRHWGTGTLGQGVNLSVPFGKTMWWMCMPNKLAGTGTEGGVSVTVFGAKANNRITAAAMAGRVFILIRPRPSVECDRAKPNTVLCRA